MTGPFGGRPEGLSPAFQGVCREVSFNKFLFWEPEVFCRRLKLVGEKPSWFVAAQVLAFLAITRLSLLGRHMCTASDSGLPFRPIYGKQKK